MDYQTRSRRTTTYVLWMLGSALIPVGLNFPMGSFFQILFLLAGIVLFISGHVLFREVWTR